MTDPRELYREHILEHSKHPRNQGQLDAPTHEQTLSNPLCGDRITVQFVCHDARIEAIRFTARGCAICVAAASLMTEWVEGKTIDDVSAMRALVDQAVQPDAAEVEPPVAALMALRAFPTRERCATLAWDALSQALG